VAIGALALGGQEADAGKRSGGAPCTKGRQCKTGKCVGTSGAKTCSCSKRYPKCITPNTTCQDGACTDECPEGTQAINGGCFRAETCAAQCGDSHCGSGGGGAGCFCSQTVSGEPVCYLNDNYCSFQVCDNDGDCAAGKACVDVACACGGGVPAVCLNPCPA
jgi:hypothetical protein